MCVYSILHGFPTSRSRPRTITKLQWTEAKQNKRLLHATCFIVFNTLVSLYYIKEPSGYLLFSGVTISSVWENFVQTYTQLDHVKSGTDPYIQDVE